MDKNQLKYQSKFANNETNSVEFQRINECETAKKAVNECIESGIKEIKFEREERCKHKSYTYFNDMYEITIL